MPGRARKLIVTERQQAILQAMTRSGTCPQAVAQRARMILLAFDGFGNQDIAEQVGWAEVRSEGDYRPAAEAALAGKRADYFQPGTLVVWDVDLLGADVVRVYRAGDPANPAAYRRGEVANGRNLVRLWSGLPSSPDRIIFSSSVSFDPIIPCTKETG
jgi:hypothetical protein